MNIKYSKSSTFLLPLLEIPKNLFECSVKSTFGKILFTNRFLNAYLHDVNIDSYKENHLFLLIRNFRDSKFDLFYSNIISYSNYVEDYEVGECIVFIFSIPEKFQEDYNLILEGKYSMVSKEAKNRIISESFYDIDPVLLPLILNKATCLRDYWENKLSNPSEAFNYYPKLGDQEVYPIINKNKEILNKEVYKLYSKNKKLTYKGE